MEDEKIVQDDGVQGTSQDGEAPKTEAPAKFGEEDVQRMVAEAIKSETQKLESKYQSLKDKEVRKFAGQAAKSRRYAESAQGMLASFGSQVAQTNPEIAQNIYSAQLAAENRLMKEDQQAAETERQADEDRKDFMATMEQTVTDMGIKGDDARIDWGKDAATIGEATKRILGSAAKAAKEDMSSMEERITKKMLKAQEDRELNRRKEEGLDSVDGTPSRGGQSDADFVKKLGSGELPINKENTDRYNRIKSTY